jgi:hypothetical protein
VFENHHTSVDVVATSEVSVSVTIDDASRLEALVVDLRALGDVTMERNRGIVSIVGNGLSDGGSAMATALEAIGDLRVYMLSLSSSGINLTVVVDGEQVHPRCSGCMRRSFRGSDNRGRFALPRSAWARWAARSRSSRPSAASSRREIDRHFRMRHVTRESLRDAQVRSSSPYRRCASNIRACVAAGCPIVVGTTGWYDQLPAVRAEVSARRCPADRAELFRRRRDFRSRGGEAARCSVA